jgi:hypothetical protein
LIEILWAEEMPMTTPDDTPHATTRIDVTGANCPWCFNAVLELLRSAPHVESVRGSIGEQLLIVDHGGADEGSLLEVVRSNLHVDARSASEHVQGAVEASLTDVACPTCEARTDRRTGR